MNKIYIKYKDTLEGFIFSSVAAALIAELLRFFISRLSTSGDKIAKVITNIFQIKISILTVVLYVGTIMVIYRTLSAIKINSRTFRIIHATYGQSGKNVDITPELNKAIIDNKLNIVLSNNIAGDPIPGTKKTGYIEYVNKGKEYEVTYSENETIQLP